MRIYTVDAGSQGEAEKASPILNVLEFPEFSRSPRFNYDFTPRTLQPKIILLIPLQKTSLHKGQSLSGNLGELCKMPTLQLLIYVVFDCL